MKVSLLVALAVAVAPAVALACGEKGLTKKSASCGAASEASSSVCTDTSVAAKPTPRTVTVAQLERMRGKKGIAVVDANGDATRAKFGVIPGATLLTSATRYDPARELPAGRDTTLIFYCANEKCTASHTAAERAIEAGYRDVAVLPAGIQGWRKAGRVTSSVVRS